MKILLFSGLLFISTLVTEKSDCDSIQLDLGITHTSEGKNNGKIEVTVEKGRAPFTVYLFAEAIIYWLSRTVVENARSEKMLRSIDQDLRP